RCARRYDLFHRADGRPCPGHLPARECLYRDQGREELYRRDRCCRWNPSAAGPLLSFRPQDGRAAALKLTAAPAKSQRRAGGMAPGIGNTPPDGQIAALHAALRQSPGDVVHGLHAPGAADKAAVFFRLIALPHTFGTTLVVGVVVI